MRDKGIGSATNSPKLASRAIIRHADSTEEGGDLEIAQAVRVLRLENKTLRLALVQSAANAARWESEMKALEEQNQRLLRALTNRQCSSTGGDNDHHVTSAWSG